MSTDQIIQIVLLLLPLIPLGTIFAQVRSHGKLLENKIIPASEQTHVESVVRSVAMAVEQTCSTMVGPQKRAEAVRMVSVLLGEKGIKVSPAMLDTLLEQAVYRINQHQDPSQTQMVQAITGIGSTLAG